MSKVIVFTKSDIYADTAIPPFSTLTAKLACATKKLEAYSVTSKAFRNLQCTMQLLGK